MLLFPFFLYVFFEPEVNASVTVYGIIPVCMMQSAEIHPAPLFIGNLPVGIAKENMMPVQSVRLAADQTFRVV